MTNKVLTSNSLNLPGSRQNRPKAVPDYIIWLINNRGSFGFTSSGFYRNKTPAFQLKITARNIKILEQIRDYLGLKNKVYKYHYPGKDKSKREPQAILTIRDFKQLKDIIIPFSYKKLVGRKRAQFMEWLEKIGSDPDVSDRFKSLYRLYKWGAYDNLPKFTENLRTDP